MSIRTVKSMLLALCVSAGLIINVQAAELDQIGTFDFPTSGSEEAQKHFILGVGYLHSFGMTQAQAEFRKAQEIEPDFAMAYWGEAFTYQHPFFGAKDEGPGRALMRLGSTSAERAAKAPTEREKGFLKAAEAYALTEGGMPERRTAWMNAMAELYEKYPQDDEVKAFFTVSMLSGATASGDDRARLNMRAGAMALQLFKKNDNHPGAAHYVIHSFDDPVHAPIALEAATAYADIAPAVSHARHMPTHIFIQHGMWDRVSQWNESAFNAGRALWVQGDRVNDMNHSSDWGQYGDLQRGDLERSELWIERAERVFAENPNDGRSESTLRTMNARHTIDSELWKLQELTDDLTASELLALGLSAVNLNDLELANAVADRLAEMNLDSPNGTLRAIHLEVAGSTKFAEARADIARGSAATGVPMQEEALAMLTEAANVMNQGREPNGAATPLKPAHELAGEALLAAGQAEAAAAMFDQSLLRTPNRPRSLIGSARSHAAQNHNTQAKAMYHAFLAVWSDDSLPSVREAKAYLGY